MAEDYKQNLIRIRSEIHSISLQLSEILVSIQIQPKPMKNRQIDSNVLHLKDLSTAQEKVFFHTGRFQNLTHRSE